MPSILDPPWNSSWIFYCCSVPRRSWSVVFAGPDPSVLYQFIYAVDVWVNNSESWIWAWAMAELFSPISSLALGPAILPMPAIKDQGLLTWLWQLARGKASSLMLSRLGTVPDLSFPCCGTRSTPPTPPRSALQHFPEKAWGQLSHMPILLMPAFLSYPGEVWDQICTVLGHQRGSQAAHWHAFGGTMGRHSHRVLLIQGHRPSHSFEWQVKEDLGCPLPSACTLEAGGVPYKICHLSTLFDKLW